MIVNNVGYNHCHDVDLKIERPDGSGDYLLLLLKSPAIFTLDGADTLVDEGTVLIYRKGTPQYYRSNGTPFSNDWVHFLFQGDELDRFLALGIPFDTPLHLGSINEFSIVVKLMTYEHYSKEVYSQEVIDGYFRVLFLKLSRAINHPATVRSTSNYDMLSTIRSKVHSKPYEHRTVEGTAHEVRMSKSRFQHLYREYFGVSLVEDVIQSRMELAKALLTDTNVNVKTVSQLCGYANYSHFERLFKSRVGTTPTQYRNRLSDGS